MSPLVARCGCLRYLWVEGGRGWTVDLRRSKAWLPVTGPVLAGRVVQGAELAALVTVCGRPS